MKTLKYPFLLILLALFVGPAWAEDDSAERGEFRAKLLEEFDADRDGELNDEERSKAREKMKGRHGKGRGKGGDKGRRGGRDGEGPPNPEELFERFDANGDGQLSRQEFHKLSKSMREHHERQGRGKGPRGEGPGRRPGPPGDSGDRPGPRREGRPKFDPLQNPGDRPEGPPRAGKGRRGPGPDGPRGEGHEGRRPPNPDEIFDRFDADDNGQLSRAEFGKLSQAMRKLHGHDRGKKMGKSRGERRGSEDKGKSGRPKLLDRDNDAGEDTEKDSPADEDDSV